MAVLMVTPTALYYGARPGRASEYFQGWTLSLSHLLLDPSLYVRWFNLVQSLMGLAALLLALTGVLIASPRLRALLLGCGGYLIYGLFLPYQMYTHSYYHLQLVPIIALSLAPARGDPRAYRPSAASVPGALCGRRLIASLSRLAIDSELKREDFRGEPAYWQQIASYLPTDGKIVVLPRIMATVWSIMAGVRFRSGRCAASARSPACAAARKSSGILYPSALKARTIS